MTTIERARHSGVCEHGCLRRSCETCDLLAEIADLRHIIATHGDRNIIAALASHDRGAVTPQGW